MQTNTCEENIRYRELEKIINEKFDYIKKYYSALDNITTSIDGSKMMVLSIKLRQHEINELLDEQIALTLKGNIIPLNK